MNYETVREKAQLEDHPIEANMVTPATVFCIKLKQPRSHLLHKMSVPELCRNFCGPWSEPDDADSANDSPKVVGSNPLDFSPFENCDAYYGVHGFWPRKRRMSERDAAFG